MQELARCRETLQAAAKQAWQAFLSDFAALYVPFKAAVQALAALDALCSLAVVSSGDGCAPDALPTSCAGLRTPLRRHGGISGCACWGADGPSAAVGHQRLPHLPADSPGSTS